MQGKWDGNDRRSSGITDHDTLVQLVQILKNQDELAKMVATNLKEHEEKDEQNFLKIREDILGLQKIVWTATGILLALDALPKLAEIFHIIK